MSLAILFHFLCAQNVSDINISHHQELATILLNYHIVRIALGSMCVGVSVWLGWSGIRVAGLIYPSSGACDYSVELPHWSYCSWFDVCWSFGVVGLEWYPCCRLKDNLSSLIKLNMVSLSTNKTATYTGLYR